VIGKPPRGALPTSLVEEGIAYPESPRWREGLLWFSDVWNFRLKACDDVGNIVFKIRVDQRPSGLGFLPDGRLLMASAQDRRLHWVANDLVTDAADLSGMTRGLLNDMVVDAQGRAYVGDTGFDFPAGEAPRPGQILLFVEGREPRSVCAHCMFPNGMAITPDGRTLYVAESLANRVSAFPILTDGALGPPRVHTELDGIPDGLCLDSAGALWVANLKAGAFLRIDANGRTIGRVDVAPAQAVACTLGGAARTTLYLCCSTPATGPGGSAKGAIYTHEAPAPGAGWP
jgi:sugar lactone lactonase YvrE